MKSPSSFLRNLILATAFGLPATCAAQATRTWVSGVGDDINPCSRTAPCKTFAGAISKTARGGEINVIDAGGYGAVTITKSITIDGTGSMASILGSLTNGILINIPTSADDAGIVRIRGLAINGAGGGLSGIKIVSATKIAIENTLIDGFTVDGVTIGAANAQVYISSTTIRNCSGAAINVAAAGSQAAINDVRLVYDGVALATNAGGSVVSFRNNVFFGNKKDGEIASTASLK
jgi:hypothetical protein